MKINCECCGKEINRKPSQIERAEHTTCSKECARELTKKLTLETRECLHCKTLFEAKKSDPKKFCSQSCSASYNNTGKVKNKTRSVNVTRFCAHCGKEITGSGLKYCSHKCSSDFVAKKAMDEYTTTWTATPQSELPKKHIISTKGYSCEICGISDWQGKPIVLQLDHIDGNADNNHEDNLRLLCPNCHTQTDTFGAKNKGNGRLYRREYRKKNYTDKGMPQH